MNEYNLKVNFEKGQIITNLRKLVQNDYNTTKINFTFDKEGRVLFKMSYPDGTQYVDEIENNELIFGKGVLNQEGTYEYEIALYTEDGRLTNHAIGKFEVRSELVNTDELVEVDDRVPVLDNLINEVNTIKQDVEEGKYNGKDGADGTDGQDGVTPTIGENGNWFIGDVDTGLPSQGPEGKPGPAGGVTLEEVTAITGNPEELQTESKQLVGAINEVLNNSGGSQEIFYLYNSSYKHSVTFTKTSGLEEIQKVSDAYESGNKPILVVRYNDGIMELYPIMYKNGDNLEGKVMTIDNNNIRFIEKRILITRTLTDGVYTVKNISTTASSFNMLASKTYVDTAIANAITTTLEGSY